MDAIIDTLALRISTFFWFAQSTRLGSDEFVSELMQEAGLAESGAEVTARLDA